MESYAIYWYEQSEPDEAEKITSARWRPILKNARNLGNYALFLELQRNDYDKAEEYYWRAAEVDPKTLNSLATMRTSYVISEKTTFEQRRYQRSVEAGPQNATQLGNYAIFLRNNRRITTKAEEYYQRAVEADPKHANILGNYANFLCDQRKDYDKAEEYYQRAVEADPKHAKFLGNYANFCGSAKGLRQSRGNITGAKLTRKMQTI